MVERRPGALPASAEFLRRLDVAGIIDELCPVRDVAHLTHGQVIEVLIANRLSSPTSMTSMVGVENWARRWAVPEVFGVDPELLNDDRIARALDAIARVWRRSPARSARRRLRSSASIPPRSTGT